MDTNNNLLLISTASTDASAPVPLARGLVAPGNDSASAIIDLDMMFGSIYYQQLGEKRATGHRATISLVTANAARTEDVTAGETRTSPRLEVDAETAASFRIVAAADTIARLPLVTTVETVARSQPASPAVHAETAASSRLVNLVEPDMTAFNSAATAQLDNTSDDENPTAPAPQNPLVTANPGREPASPPGIESEKLVPPAAANSARTTGRVSNPDRPLLVGNQVLAESPNSSMGPGISPQPATSTALPASRLNLIKTTGLNRYSAKQHLVPSHPLAGSLATPSDEVTPQIRQTLAVEQVAASESTETRWSGKSVPPSGNNPPGNLLFNSKPSDAPAQISGISDLMHKAAYQSLQLLHTGDSQSAPQQPAQGEATSAVLNPGGPNNVGRLVGGQVGGTSNLEGSTSFLIQSSVGSPDWNHQLGSRIRWMSKVNISSAELRLHPAELGAVEIKISTEDDITKVHFLTSNLAAKEIIEASLPRLRDLLASSGLQLEHSDVSQKNLTDNKAGQEKTATKDPAGREHDIEQEDSAIRVRQRSLNQIDHYV